MSAHQELSALKKIIRNPFSLHDWNSGSFPKYVCLQVKWGTWFTHVLQNQGAVCACYVRNPAWM